MQFVDPITGDHYEFKHIPITQLFPGEYQRELSTGLVGKLAKSMIHGFFTPLMVIEKHIDDVLVYEIIDGQHRYGAIMKMASGTAIEVPCIVMPSKFKELPLIFNIEKSDNIKDICAKLYHYYINMVENFGAEVTEQAMQNATLGLPYYITLSIAYKEFGIKSPSLVESIAKKLDTAYFAAAVGDAYGYRQTMAQSIVTLERAVEAACEKFHIKDANLKKSIVSKTATDLGWSRITPDCNFLEGIDLMIAKIESSNWGWMAGK